MENTNTSNEVIQLSIEQIIDETVEYYKSNPRGKYGHSSVYKNSDGAMCAVGRCFTDEAIGLVIKDNLNTSSVVTLSTHYPLNDLFKPQYKHKDINFWRKLQVLHDTPQYFKLNNEANKGYKLSDAGEKYVQELKDEFSNE